MTLAFELPLDRATLRVGNCMEKLNFLRSNTWLDHCSFTHAPLLKKDAADADDVPQDLARGMAIYSATRLQQHDGQHTVALMTIPACGILRMRSPRP